MKRLTGRKLRERKAVEGCLFRGERVRSKYVGESDLPTFGKFTARVRIGFVTCVQLESGAKWSWINHCGSIGGWCDSEPEAMAEGLAALRRDGFTDDLDRAELEAIRAAKEAHDLKLNRSPAYAQHYG